MSKIISINKNLAPVKNRYHQQYNDLDVEKYWFDKLNGYVRRDEKPQYTTQYTLSNCTPNMNGSKSFLDAFLSAYNNHEDVVISPDDVWMVICLNFTKYVNDNAEKLRSKFVDHEGQKRLTVVEPIGKDEHDWDDFFGQMVKEIDKNVKGNIVSILKSNFSTTGKVEAILSNACIMDSFQKYFSYGRCIPCCGIRNVHFLGSLDDWLSLRKKADDICSFDEEPGLLGKKRGDFSKYIQNLLPILDEFINTYKGNVNNKFWDKIMNFRDGRLGSGSTTYISGWILNFFLGYSQDREVDYGDISLNSIKVPVEVTNHCTGQQKTCYVTGGFFGVRKDGETYRPCMSLSVLEDSKTVKGLF